jgi:hypothetical protein
MAVEKPDHPELVFLWLRGVEVSFAVLPMLAVDEEHRRPVIRLARSLRISGVALFEKSAAPFFDRT